MATALITSGENETQCFICMEFDTFLSCDIKLLPCSHTVCTKCLLTLSEVSTQVFSCKTCRSVTVETVANVPSASGKKTAEEIILCHVCEKKNEKDKDTADMFCYNCNNVFCDNHSGPHFELNPEHNVVEIAVYRRAKKKLEKRLCPVHKDQGLSFGCPECYKTFCVTCLPENINCPNGGSHKFTVLGKLEKIMLQELDKLRVEAQQRESEADRLVRDTVEGLENWDKKTEELVSQLHQSRDKYIKYVMEEYERLEIKLEAHRSKGRKEREVFLEQKVETMHKELERKLQVNDDRMNNYHQVDLVGKYKESLEFLKSLTTYELPYMNMKGDVASLKVEETEFIPVMELLTEGGETVLKEIAPNPPPSTATPPSTVSPPKQQQAPAGIRFIREVKFDNLCTTVCHYNGFTYVGQEVGATDRIDQQGNVRKAFIRPGGFVVSLAAYNNRLYSLVYINGTYTMINVYDITDGSLLTSWDHPMIPYFGQHIAIINNQLAVGDWPAKQIIIYSQAGDIIRTLSCPPALTMKGNVSMSSCGDDSLVLSDRLAGKVVRISSIDGKIEWRSNNASKPGGIVHHPSGVVLVTANWLDHTEISALDESNGNLNRVLTDPAKRSLSTCLDLCLYGTTLIVPKYQDNSVLIYEILTE